MTTAQRIADQDWRPNLFIAGFAKCGTTELCDYLSQHPDLFIPYEKEPHTFYDLGRFPGYFSGNHTGHEMPIRITSLNDYYKLFSKGKKRRYRIDGTVSYGFDPKFSSVLKSFSENAKIILSIRNQAHRLVSMYYFSFSIHKENNFAKWLDEYFIPYIQSYLYYDKIVAYYNEFGSNDNLRIIETKNLSSEGVHSQIFEFLGVKPVKIHVRHKNANLIGPTDSKIYRQVILTLTPFKVKTVEVAQKLGLKNQANRASYILGDLARQLFNRSRHTQKNSNYSEILRLIPHTVSSLLDEDYKKTMDFVVEKRVVIRPQC